MTPESLAARLNAYLARPWSADPLTLDRDDAAAVVGLLGAANGHRGKFGCRNDARLDAALAAFDKPPVPDTLLSCEWCSATGGGCGVCRPPKRRP
jgi:hypothetical protein